MQSLLQSTTPPATENKKKNKKDKKKSESEKVTEQPVESAPAPPQVEQVVEVSFCIMTSTRFVHLIHNPIIARMANSDYPTGIWKQKEK